MRTCRQPAGGQTDRRPRSRGGRKQMPPASTGGRLRSEPEGPRRSEPGSRVSARSARRRRWGARRWRSSSCWSACTPPRARPSRRTRAACAACAATSTPSTRRDIAAGEWSDERAAAVLSNTRSTRLREKQAAAAAKRAAKKAAPKQACAGGKRPLQPVAPGAANARQPGKCRICGLRDGHNARTCPVHEREG